MSSWREVVGIAGAVLVAAGSLYYLYDVLRSNSRPQRASWAVWSLIGLLGFGATHSAGAGPGAYTAGVYTVAYVVTFLVSLSPRYGKPGGERYDYPLCLVAMAGVVLWRYGPLGDGLAVTLSIVCDGAALWPTLRDAWRAPETESRGAWSVETAGNLLALCSVQTWVWSGAAYPAYLLLATGSVAATLTIASRRRTQASEPRLTPA